MSAEARATALAEPFTALAEALDQPAALPAHQLPDRVHLRAGRAAVHRRRLYAGAALAGVALVTTSLGLLGPLSMLIAGALLKPDEPEPLTVRLRDAATALALTTGLLLSNGRAVLEAFAGLRSPFVRTPKGPVASGVNVHKSKGMIAPATAGIAARLRPGLAGVPELLAGSALLVFRC